MSGAANPARGECALRVDGCELVLRPSFQALVAAEQELGSLFDLVARAAEGKLGLGELAALFWHCLRDIPEGMTRETLGEALIGVGLAKLTPVLRGVLQQILAGR
ncbi:gene transfer agent family protein [Sphingomonas sp. RP10(2022)]|uniref:Gene transfer agent family protein n=1 Tax=Sphingomonas liriopis TaxID=2949094 RepID=A0A9X2KTM3_9SPHN|nr:gene transfer agent family protein [Sphingomonas liriopis]